MFLTPGPVLLLILTFCRSLVAISLFGKTLLDENDVPKSPNEILGSYLADFDGHQVAGETISNQNVIYKQMFRDYIKSLAPVTKFQQQGDETTTVVVYLDFYPQWFAMSLDGKLTGNVKVEMKYQDDRLIFGNKVLENLHLPFWVDPEDLWMPDIRISQW